MGWQDDPIVSGGAQSAQPAWMSDPVVEQAQAEPPPVTALDRANAGAAGFNRGVAGIAGIPIDTIQNIIDLGKALSGTVYSSVSGKPVPQALEVESDRSNLIGSGDYFRKALGSAAEVPRADLASQRYIAAAGQGASGAMLGPSTGVPMVPSLVSNIAGSEASQVAAESGAGPAGQILAGMAGGAAANATRATLAEGVKRSFRGGEAGRQKTAENIQAFEDAGDTPTVGQATQNRRMQSAESAMSRLPGSAGPMSRKGEAQAANIGAGLEKQANTLSPRASAEQAGRAIEKGVRGEGGFVEKFKARQSQLYDELDRHVAEDAPVGAAATQKALSELNADIPGAPNLSEWFKNARIKGIEGALDKDIGPNAGPGGASTIPYKALKKLRTLVGDEVTDSSIMSDVPRSKWKALYGALSDDLKQAADDAGPEARTAWNRANNYTRAGMRRLETIDHVIEKNGGPEAVFTAATSGTKEGATTLRAVMQSLPPEAQKTVSATVLRRLGRATPGRQNDLGEKFSTETFLTNWNSMSPQAKAVLFDRYGPEFRQNMNQVAKVASNLREGSKVFQNPSGTAQAGTQIGTAVAFGTAIATGNFPTAAGIAGGVTGANLMARLMVHPPFVQWLAKTTKAPPNALPALTLQLAQSGNDDEKEFARLLQQSQNQPNDNRNRN